MATERSLNHAYCPVLHILFRVVARLCVGVNVKNYTEQPELSGDTRSEFALVGVLDG